MACHGAVHFCLRLANDFCVALLAVVFHRIDVDVLAQLLEHRSEASELYCHRADRENTLLTMDADVIMTSIE